MNISKLCESESGNFAGLKKQIFNELRCNTLAYVTSVNTNKKTLNAQPIVQEVVNTPNGKQYIKLPEILNIPYLTKTGIPKNGEYCLLCHLDRSINNADLNVNDIVLIQGNSNRHSIGDCVAIVGFGNANIDNDILFSGAQQLSTSSTIALTNPLTKKHISVQFIINGCEFIQYFCVDTQSNIYLMFINENIIDYCQIQKSSNTIFEFVSGNNTITITSIKQYESI